MKHLAGLIQAIVDTRQRRIAVDLANALNAVNSSARLSAVGRFEALAAEAAWVAAKAALTRYHATNF